MLLYQNTKYQIPKYSRLKFHKIFFLSPKGTNANEEDKTQEKTGINKWWDNECRKKKKR